MKKKTIITLAALALLAILGILVILGVMNSRIHTTEPVRLYLPEDEYTSFKGLCDEYHMDAPFRLMVRVAGMQGKRVRPGSYLIEPDMKSFTLLRKLRNGQQDPLRLTIGKFRTPQQLNEFLNSKLMHNDFEVPLDSFHIILPDTYEFYWTVTPEQFMQRMRKEYDKFWSEKIGANGECRFELLSMSDFIPDIQLATIIIASIVEEETNYGPEKPLVANVYWNRLDKGIPLQADPTVKYAVGDFTLRRILNKHLAVESPFNTYLHTGLPPAPICLPSKATIDATINGEDLETNYLYFCASEQMDGTHRFAATLDEHNRNAARFHRALNQLGIRN